jgi:hypothetical protein
MTHVFQTVDLVLNQSIQQMFVTYYYFELI